MALPAGPVAASAPATTVKVRVKDLNVYYGSNHAIRDASLDVEEKRVTALIGPSGCGKSTFLRAINRLHDLTPSARVTGIVEVDGVNVYSRDVDPIVMRRRVGMVFQRPNPFPMSIFDNVAFGLRVNGERDSARIEEVVEESLRRAVLWDEVQDRLSESGVALSGGQQQRLCVARVLALRPEVILMDEPASALDPIATVKIEELIAELRREYTVVIVTHSMAQAGRVSDRTAFFLNGSIVETGPTNQIFTRPKDKRTEDYITGRFG
ncbi:MAG TPA: phosphate ABC transporter ATP-binding protein PstB [Candidatus Elarobacter sp.]|nr:phosphate ABC transporter ATP-binding protein PstB [Candidatus Elarobacter sp.]